MKQSRERSLSLNLSNGFGGLEDFRLQHTNSDESNHMYYELDEDDFFNRTFISFNPVMRAAGEGIPVLSCDACECVVMGFKWCILTLISRTANGKNLLVCAAIVSCENAANYLWFFIAVLELVYR